MREDIKDFYVCSTNDLNKSFGIRIIKGRFKDLLVKIGKVALEENEDETKCTIHFEHEIIENPNNLYLDGNNKTKLDNLIGDALFDIINDFLEKQGEKEIND